MRTAGAISTLFILSFGLTLRAAPAPPPAVSPDAFAKSAMLDQSSRFEGEIAALMERRGEPNDLGETLLDLQIDVRVVSRWLIAKAAEAQPGGDFQVCAFLRAGSLLSAVRQLSQTLQSTRDPLSKGQLDGLKKFHDLTYKLPDLKGIGKIDDFCHDVSVALFSAAGPLSSELKNIPMMRPPLPKDDSQAHAAALAAPSMADLIARAQKAGVSAPLRRQLVALAAAAADPQPPEAAPALIDALAQALDLADGIQHNTALDAVARPKLESQLADGLALFADVRTRPAGKNRLDALGRYRDTLARIRRLKLTGELQEKLAPAFVWIQQNPDKGSRVFTTIEDYLRLCGRFDSRKSPATLAPNSRKVVDDLSRQFSARRAGFLDDASQLNGAGGAVAGDGAESLSATADSMRDALAGIDAVERLPRALQVLAAYKPHPSGALERRAAQAVTTSAGALTQGQRAEAAGVIIDIEKLAALAGEAAPIAAEIPGATAKNWADSKLEAFDSRRGGLISDLASQSASGRSMDSAKLDQLQLAADLAKAIRDAAMIDAVLHRGEVLQRWVDWQIDPEQLRNLFEVYRTATAAAFDGFAQGDTFALNQWPALHHQNVPLIVFVTGAAAYASPCEHFPDGLVSELAKLATPLENQPFATERRASVTIALRTRALQLNDAKIAAALADALAAGLRKDLHLPE